MRNLSFVLLILVAAVPLASGSAQGEAQAHLDARHWEDAANSFVAITKVRPGSADAWAGLGQARLEQARFPEALAAYQKAGELRQLVPGAELLGAARAAAGLGRTSQALELLETLAKRDSSLRGAVRGATEFRGLVEEARFQRVLERMRPCNTPEYRQFDFWLGEWNVTAVGDNHPKRNRIRRILEGCAVREDYVSGSYRGSSLSFYDAASKRWHQTWIDNQGKPLHLSGSRDGESMVLESDPKASPRQRITWTPGARGSVRQLWQTSSDRGKTWTVAFDGTYTRTED